MEVLKVDYQQADAAAKFTESLKETGFAVLTNHPIKASLIKLLYSEWESFFATEEKCHYRFTPGAQDGFFPQDVSETAKGAEVPDIKEFYQFYPWGQYPAMLSDATKEMYIELSSLAAVLLQWIEDNTPSEVKKNFSVHLSQMIQGCKRTMLRIIHYPPIKGDETPGAIRAAAHEDINLITLLVTSTASGLEVQDNKGNWHAVPCEVNSIAVNVGDMLQECSDGYFNATTHRVINPEGEDKTQSRLSMPLFLHARDDVVLSKKHTAYSYLSERLKELGILGEHDDLTKL